jgi:SnoaL-like domain
MGTQTFRQVTTTVGVFLVIGAAGLGPSSANAVIGGAMVEQTRGSGKAMGLAEKLWEMEQIKLLKARYLRYLDTRKWKEFRELFTDDFVWYLPEGDGKKVRNPTADDFVKHQSENFDQARVISVHQGKMPEIELVSETTARGIWEMSDWVDHPKGRAIQGWGYYYEEYEKGRDAKWRFKSIHLARLRVDEVPSSKEIDKEYPTRGQAPWWPFKR